MTKAPTHGATESPGCIVANGTVLPLTPYLKTVSGTPKRSGANWAESIGTCGPSASPPRTAPTFPHNLRKGRGHATPWPTDKRLPWPDCWPTGDTGLPLLYRAGANGLEFERVADAVPFKDSRCPELAHQAHARTLRRGDDTIGADAMIEAHEQAQRRLLALAPPAGDLHGQRHRPPGGLRRGLRARSPYKPMGDDMTPDGKCRAACIRPLRNCWPCKKRGADRLRPPSRLALRSPHVQGRRHLPPWKPRSQACAAGKAPLLKRNPC